MKLEYFYVLEDFVLEETEFETPICKMKTGKLNEDKFTFAPILRAGMGILNGIINFIQNAKIGHIGMYRNDPNGHIKVPKNIEEKEVIILEPMLAIGGRAIDAIDLLKEKRLKKIKFLCIIYIPKGLKKVS